MEEDKDPEKVELLQEVIKVRNQDQVIPVKLVLKVDKCLCNVEFRNLDLRNINRKEYKGINLRTLQALADKLSISEITPEVLIGAGLVSKSTLVKILGVGKLKAKLNVKAHAFSETAKNAIEAAKGTAEKI